MASLSRAALVAAVLTLSVLGALVSAQRSATALVTAGDKLLASLSPEQRAQALFPIESDERYTWNYIPDEMFPRNGVALKTLTSAQRALVHDLLKAGLSQRGYMTFNAIMELESILKEVERTDGDNGRRFVRDPLGYHVSIFGTPSTDHPWGWRIDGHHVSLHFTVVKGRLVATSPTFAGTNPAEVREGRQKGLRILGEQEDTARAFLMSLTPQQQAVAIIDRTAPNDIVSGNKAKVDPMAPAGIAAKALPPEERLALMKVIRTYTGLMADDLAIERLGRVYSAGIENIYFAWAGGMQRGEQHYYRIQGPTFLIEYDNAQNDGNHVHSVWRDFTGDFGRDILREHLSESHPDAKSTRR